MLCSIMRKTLMNLDCKVRTQQFSSIIPCHKHTNEWHKNVYGHHLKMKRGANWALSKQKAIHVIQSNKRPHGVLIIFKVTSWHSSNRNYAVLHLYSGTWRPVSIAEYTAPYDNNELPYTRESANDTIYGQNMKINRGATLEILKNKSNPRVHNLSNSRSHSLPHAYVSDSM